MHRRSNAPAAGRRGPLAGWIPRVILSLAVLSIVTGILMVIRLQFNGLHYRGGGGSATAADHAASGHERVMVIRGKRNNSAAEALFDFDPNIGNGKTDAVPATDPPPSEIPHHVEAHDSVTTKQHEPWSVIVKMGGAICPKLPPLERHEGEANMDFALRVKRRLRFAIVSIAAPGWHGEHRQTSRWMTNFTLVNKHRYAMRRNYDLHVVGVESLDPALPPSWSKIKVIRRYLPSYDYVLWVDEDTLFMNFEKSVEELVMEYPYEELVIAKDHNGINCGVMLFKSTQRMLSLLDEVWHFEGDRGHMWQEQHALAVVLARQPKYEQAVAYAPNQALNAYPYTASEPSERWSDGNLLVHFANCDSRPASCLEEFIFYWTKWLGDDGKVTHADLRALPYHFHVVHV